MTAIESLVARFCEAWNRHDVEELSLLWSEDGELVHPWGDRAVGRYAIRELLGREHASSMAGSTIRLTAEPARIGDGHVVADLHGVLDGVLAPNGRSYSLPHTISAMFVDDSGHWRIRAMAPIANPR
ncbi:MAG: nuclear transport factor 2 family protein [Acidobacteriota bacterium]